MFVIIVFQSKERALDKSKQGRINLSWFNILDPRILSLRTGIRSKHVKCRGQAHTGTEEATGGPSGGKHTKRMHTSQIMIHFSKSLELGNHVYLLLTSKKLY